MGSRLGNFVVVAMFQQEKPGARRTLLMYAALPLAYIVCGRLGLLLAGPPGYATAVFLPAGIAVAAMFVAGAATLPGIFIGAFLLNVWVGYTTAHHADAAGIAAAAGIALASSVQAALGGSALRSLIGYPAPLDLPRDLLLFLLLSPVFCLTSATLSLSGMWALGIVSTADFVANWVTWWVGDTLGVLVGLPLVLVLVGEPRNLWLSRAGLVAVPMLLCFALFVAIFVRVTKWEQEESLLEFRMQSQRVTDVLRSTLEEQALLLGQLARVFSNTPGLTRQDFDGLVQQLLQRFPTIQAVEWAPRVAAAERAAFERAQQSNAPGFAIRERDSSGELRPASDRNEHYPVTYIDPRGDNEQALGFDLSSSPERRAAIETAARDETVAATAPIRLVQEPGGQAGILLVHAVSGRNGPGVVLIVLRMGTFAGTVAAPLASILWLRLVDTVAAQPLFASLPASAPAVYEANFEFGARRYLVQTAPSPIYLARHRGWQSWAVLAAGVLGTALLGALLILGTGHAYRFKMLADNLREREAELDTIVKKTPFILIRCSPDLRYRFVSEAYAQMLGRRPEEIVGKRVAQVLGDEAFRTVLPYIEKVLQGERVEYDTEIPYETAGKRFLHGVYLPEKDEQGNVTGWIASIADITERKRAESQRDLLVAELSHRVKNTLATVISIANQSFSKSRSADEGRRSFDDRIRALAQTHARLAEANWSGVSLEAIVRDETAPYQDGSSNILMSGPPITLGPKQAVSLGMAIHELATNAAKHGALSTKGGSLTVRWQIAPSQDEVQLSWSEHGGPTVGPPQHSGFGRMLLERALASDLNGKVTLDFAPEGLKCLMAFPLGGQQEKPVASTTPDVRPAEDAAPVSADRARSARRKAAHATRVLVVEDEALLAMELEGHLQGLGYTIVGPFGDLARATEACRREAIDVAVLDTNLNGEMVYPLADDLSAHGIPFIFVTGYSASNLPERFRGAPRVAKPYDPATLTTQLERTAAKA
jgi:PAS domain S-box-containing protein